MIHEQQVKAGALEQISHGDGWRCIMVGGGNHVVLRQVDIDHVSKLTRQLQEVAVCWRGDIHARDRCIVGG